MTGWADAAALKARDGMGSLTTDQATAAIEAATDLLDALTMSQFGTHAETVRPEGCGRTCDPGAPSTRAVVGWGLAAPLARVVGPWPLGAGPYGGMTGGCGCCGTTWTTGFKLQGPVVSVEEVRVDGAVLDASAYQVWDDAILLRTDGKPWPRCQSMLLAATEIGTFSVSYTHGQPVPAMGVQAVLSLAAELAKLWLWIDGDCKLPARVTSITRQGVTMAVVDDLSIIRDGGTGLADVDMFLASLRAPRRAVIATPGIDSGLHRRTI